MRNVSMRLLTTALAFTIYLTAGPGSAVAQLSCQPSANAPVNVTGSLTTSDPTQTGRISRSNFQSSCIGKSAVLLNSNTVHYKSYTATSPVTGCATVDFNTSACSISTNQVFLVAYSSFNPASPASNVIGDAGSSVEGKSSFAFPVTVNQAYTIVVHEIAPNTGCSNFSFTVTYSTGCRQIGFDRGNDGKADATVFRPSTSDWFILNTGSGPTSENFGLAGDIPTTGDYTGDGQTDMSTYRPSTNFWFYGNSHTNPGKNFTGIRWGLTGDVPVPGDYDRDGKTDIAIWRPSDGYWYILRSSNNTLQTAQWGKNGDIPVIGDFDGDRIVDYAVVRPSGQTPGAYTWWIFFSNFDYSFYDAREWGFNTDKLVPADFTGDGATDIAVWRPSDGVWYVLNINVFPDQISYFQFGANGDIPQPADYDGDKIADYAVGRLDPGSQAYIWYIHRSSDNTWTGFPWGAAGDQLATSAYPIQ